MADIADMANKEIAAIEQAAFKAHRHTLPSFTYTSSKCEACGEPIPLARQKAIPGVRLCVGCQAESEHGNC